MSSTSDLPPSPLSSFIESDDSIGGIVLSGYDMEYMDPSYHSNFDTNTANGGYKDIDKLALISTTTILAKSLISIAKNEKSSSLSSIDISVNHSLVEDLITCLTKAGLNCSQLSTYFSSEVVSLWSSIDSTPTVDYGTSPPSYYASVLSSVSGLPLFVKNGQAYSK
jgi:hypothetical protein